MTTKTATKTKPLDTIRSRLHVPSLREMKVYWDRVGYNPSAEQLAIHLAPHRERLVAGGERGGKSYFAHADILPYTPETELGWIVAADYRQSRAEFSYLINSYTKLGLLEDATFPRNEFQPAVMRLKTGGMIRTITAADESKLGMVAPNWIVAAEAAQLTESLYKRLRGRLAEKRGWLLMEGTFENSQDWYAQYWEDWKAGTAQGQISFSLPTWSNLAIFPGGYDDPEIQALLHDLGEERFSERHGGVPVPPASAVFREFRHQKHVVRRDFDPERPVEVAIDPGYAGAYAVCALQWDNSNVYVIDEVYVSRLQAREVTKLVKEKPWSQNVDPRRAGVIDIAGKQHHEELSHTEIWALPRSRGGMGWHLESVFVPIEDGIERLRASLTGHHPEIWFSAGQTLSTVREFKNYKYRDDAGTGMAIKEKPIDRDNHAIKAITYWLVSRYGYVERRNKKMRRVATFSIDNKAVSNGSFGKYPGVPGRDDRQRVSRQFIRRPTNSVRNNNFNARTSNGLRRA